MLILSRLGHIKTRVLICPVPFVLPSNKKIFHFFCLPKHIKQGAKMNLCPKISQDPLRRRTWRREIGLTEDCWFGFRNFQRVQHLFGRQVEVKPEDTFHHHCILKMSLTRQAYKILISTSKVIRPGLQICCRTQRFQLSLRTGIPIRSNSILSRLRCSSATLKIGETSKLCGGSKTCTCGIHKMSEGK